MKYISNFIQPNVIITQSQLNNEINNFIVGKFCKNQSYTSSDQININLAYSNIMFTLLSIDLLNNLTQTQLDQINDIQIQINNSQNNQYGSSSYENTITTTDIVSALQQMLNFDQGIYSTLIAAGNNYNYEVYLSQPQFNTFLNIARMSGAPDMLINILNENIYSFPVSSMTLMRLLENASKSQSNIDMNIAAQNMNIAAVTQNMLFAIIINGDQTLINSLLSNVVLFKIINQQFYSSVIDIANAINSFLQMSPDMLSIIIEAGKNPNYVQYNSFTQAQFNIFIQIFIAMGAPGSLLSRLQQINSFPVSLSTIISTINGGITSIQLSSSNKSSFGAVSSSTGFANLFKPDAKNVIQNTINNLCSNIPEFQKQLMKLTNSITNNMTQSMNITQMNEMILNNMLIFYIPGLTSAQMSDIKQIISTLYNDIFTLISDGNGMVTSRSFNQFINTLPQLCNIRKSS